MNNETQRRAYLQAMQVDVWVPRVVLPHAAPSDPALLAEALDSSADERKDPVAAVADVLGKPAAPTARPAPIEAPRVRLVEPAPKPVAVEPVADVPVPAATPVPRFTLQLLRAGACLLLVELPTGEPFASRDPAYLLLKDILRASGLPDAPQQVGDGEPVRWPLIRGGSLDQGEQAACDYVQGLLLAELEQAPCACLWLVGPAALRYAGEADPLKCNQELSIEGLGVALVMPALDRLMDEPDQKRALWAAIRRSMHRWNTPHE